MHAHMHNVFLYICYYILYTQSYYIADTSEQQVFVAVYHQKNLSNLYISEEEGISYSLSLDNVLFDDPALSSNQYYKYAYMHMCVYVHWQRSYWKLGVNLTVVNVCTYI